MTAPSQHLPAKVRKVFGNFAEIPPGRSPIEIPRRGQYESRLWEHRDRQPALHQTVRDDFATFVLDVNGTARTLPVTVATGVPRAGRVGLVLGAGGPVAHALYCGVLLGLTQATGWDPRTAAVIVGTSAGAQVAALLRAGISAA